MATEVVLERPKTVDEASQNAGLETEPPSTAADYARFRKEFSGLHSQTRFSMLKDWISINMLAILRRASREWNTAAELISIVPAHLEPEAEIVQGKVLLVGTPGHPEKLAIPVRPLDPSTDLGQCFEFVRNGLATASTPAVLLRSKARFEIVSKGIFIEGHLLDRSNEALNESHAAALSGILARTIEAFLRDRPGTRLTIAELQYKGLRD